MQFMVTWMHAMACYSADYSACHGTLGFFGNYKEAFDKVAEMTELYSSPNKPPLLFAIHSATQRDKTAWQERNKLTGARYDDDGCIILD